MKNLYLLTIPLIALGASASSEKVAAGKAHMLFNTLMIMNDDDPAGLKVEYPSGYGAMKLAGNSADLVNTMFKVVNGKAGWLGIKNAAPFGRGFPSRVLDNDFNFNVTDLSVDFEELRYDGFDPDPEDGGPEWNEYSSGVKFTGAVLKTTIGRHSDLVGKTATITFASDHKSEKGTPLYVDYVGPTGTKTTHFGVKLSNKAAGEDANSLALTFQMLCVEHPTTGDGKKGPSSLCPSEAFKPASGSLTKDAGVDKYKMLLRGGEQRYLRNTISFIPMGVEAWKADKAVPPGTYTSNLNVTFSLEG